DLAFRALVALDQGRVEFGGNFGDAGDFVFQVSPLAVQSGRTVPADRSDDIGAVAGSDFSQDGVLGGSEGHNFHLQEDFALGGIEVIHHRLLGNQLSRIGTGTQTDEPADTSLA